MTKVCERCGLVAASVWMCSASKCPEKDTHRKQCQEYVDKHMGWGVQDGESVEERQKSGKR